jgi:hypothetical protein
LSAHKKTRPQFTRRPTKRVLIGETREEEEARLAAEIAAHPVTKCEPGVYTPTTARPGWSNQPLIPQADATEAERIAKKMRKSRSNRVRAQTLKRLSYGARAGPI